MSKIKYVQTPNFHIETYTLKQPQPNMHYHHAYELYYILEGEREYFVGDTFFKLKKGDFILLHPMKETADALEDILSYYKNNNLKTVTVSQNLQKEG